MGVSASIIGGREGDERGFKTDSRRRAAKQRQPSGREELLSTMIRGAIVKEEE